MCDITAIVLTLNEETFIKGCLESLKWCERLLVFDSFSSDCTVEIARQCGAQVIQRQFINYADQRNAAIEQVEGGWIFFVDADERVTPELAEEVQCAVKDPSYDGWWIPRRNNLLGRWLNYGGFYPDYHLRLARKNMYHYDPDQTVHEVPVFAGNTGYLSNPLLHYWYQDMDEMLSTRAKYATYLAEMHFGRGILPTYHLLAAPLYVFLKQLFYLKGYKDGYQGLIISLVWGYSKFLEYWKVWGLRLAARRDKMAVQNLHPS